MTKSKQLILFLFLSLIASISMGQTYIGAFAGLNMSKLAGDVPAYAKYKSLMGANVGANIDVKLAKIIYLSFQPSYSQEGTKVSYSLPGSEEPVDSIKFRLNYFSLPVLLKITSTNKRFYGIAGIETALMLNNSVTVEDQKEEIGENIAQWNLAMHFGAGIRIPVGFPRLFVEVRYTQGLLNLTDEPLDGEHIIPRVKTSGFKIMAGIEIPLKKSKK